MCLFVWMYVCDSWFSKEQYFDPGGFFILTVFSGPIIINCFIIVVGVVSSVVGVVSYCGRYGLGVMMVRKLLKLWMV